MKPTRDPGLADYRDQVMRRDLRICEWLGMDPAMVTQIDAADPDPGGRVEVTWEAAAPQQPRHGKVIETGARGGWREPTIHRGKLLLHADDSRELLGMAGPRPPLPISAEDRAKLDAMRAAATPR